MTDLQLGAKLRLPLDAVTRTTGIVGQRGTGKTSTAVVMVEEAARAGAHFAVVDPTGAWYGLRSSANGEGPGLECIVFGGWNGDVPLEQESGAFVARLVIEEGLSVVLDLEKLTKGGQVRFVAEFCEELYHRNRSALLLVVDEAHRFAPQQLRDPGGYGARCLGAVTDVVTLGRRKGLGAVLISQRPAKIAKDVFEQAEIMVAHRLMGPNDRKAIGGWLEETGIGTSGDLDELQRLPRGTAIVHAPTYEVGGIFEIRLKRTFDSSSTPEVGGQVVLPKVRADVDLAALEARMAETLERQRQDDPKHLRARIRDLERQLTAAPAGVSSDDLAAAHADADAARADRDAAERRVAKLDAAALGALEQVDALRAALLKLAYSPEPPADAPARPPLSAAVPAGQRPSAPVTAPPPSRARAAPAVNGAGPPIKAGARRMLQAIASLHPLALTRAQVGTLSKVKHTGGTFASYLSALRQHALIDETNGRLTLTQAGFDELGTAPPAPASTEEILELWRDRLKAGARRMLDELVSEHPRALTRHELADRAEVTASGGTFASYLSMLRQAQLIDEDADGVRAGGVLYLNRSHAHA